MNAPSELAAEVRRNVAPLRQVTEASPMVTAGLMWAPL